MLERIAEILFNYGLPGAIIFLLAYGFYLLASPILIAFLDSVKKQTEANIKFANSIPDLSEAINDLSTSNAEHLEDISKLITKSKEEIISHIKKEL